ncbi:MAG: SPOR domain-containing protein [Candidatus Rokubacteria bacterium]|nr:SPOR domain-containing protein [Candidatus Rokubacteria bacterium]
MNREPKHSDEEGDDLPEPPRSIFSEAWFRALVAGVVLVVLAVFALPYVLERWSPTPPPTPVVKAPIPPPPPPLETPPVQKAEAPRTTPGLPAAKPEAAPPKTPAKPAQPEAKPPARPLAKAPEPAPSKAGTGGDYWVQVGAFSDQANAARLAAQLSAEKYPAQRLSLERPVAGAHEVFVVGAPLREVNGRLPTKELRAEAVGPEVVIRPVLPLKEAVSLSKELSRHGLSVKIRRASSTATFHVVRVGGYPDRQRAQTVQKDLAGKGFAGFIVRREGR